MDKPNRQPQIGSWQITMLFLSVYVLVALFVETIFELPPEVSQLLMYVDTVICLVFIGDFLVQLATAESKKSYLKWGWIDLVSSIPYLPFLRIGRLSRVIRVLRLLRGIRSTKMIVTFLFYNRARGVLATVAMITFVLMVFASVAMLNVEKDAESNIKTAEDALWWSIATITTVGYGDYYPKTSLGRVVAAVLMIAGVGLFGTFTASVASFFVEHQRKQEEDTANETLRQLDEIRNRLSRLENRGSKPQFSKDAIQ